MVSIIFLEEAQRTDELTICGVCQLSGEDVCEMEGREGVMFP